MLSPEESVARQRIVDNAIANQRLEGLSLDNDTLSDARAFVAGHLEASDILSRLKCRAEDEVHK